MGKVLELTIPNLHTRYTLIVGKTDASVTDDSEQANYHRDMFFIASLDTGKFATFSRPDEHMHFRLHDRGLGTAMDCFAISRWLLSLGPLDNLINSSEFSFSYELPQKYRVEFSRHMAGE